METNYALVRIISIVTFIYITRLIYTHKLKVGYSWFLFLLGTGFFILSIWPGAINHFYWITGSTSWLSNVLFFLVMFLFIILIHCSIIISRLTDRVKELGQQIALSFAEIDEKNLNKLINSLQTINTRITNDVLTPTNSDHLSSDHLEMNNAIHGVRKKTGKKLYADQLTKRISVKSKVDIPSPDKVNDPVTS